MSFTKITLVGNVGNLDGKPVELHYKADGTPYCSFSVGADSWQSGEKRTVWHRCTFWGKQAETAAKYAEKGKAIYVEGYLSVSEWVDREGKDRYTIEVRVNHWEWLGEGLSSLFREAEELEGRALEQERTPSQARS